MKKLIFLIIVMFFSYSAVSVKKCVLLDNNCVLSAVVPEYSDINVCLLIKNSSSMDINANLLYARFVSRNYVILSNPSRTIELKPFEEKRICYKVRVFTGKFALLPSYLTYSLDNNKVEVFSNIVEIRTKKTKLFYADLFIYDGSINAIVFNKTQNRAKLMLRIYCKDGAEIKKELFVSPMSSKKLFFVRKCEVLYCSLMSEKFSFPCNIFKTSRKASYEVFLAFFVLIFFSLAIILYIKFFVK